MHPIWILERQKTGFEHNEYFRKQLLFMISSFFQWPIRIITETILWCTIIFLAFFTRSQYHELIAAYHSPPPKETRPNFMMSNPTFCMLPYHLMIFFVVMIIIYCINGRSEMMSLYSQYKNAHWLKTFD